MEAPSSLTHRRSRSDYSPLITCGSTGKEKRLLIVTIQSHCLIFLISFFEVTNLYRIIETPRICKKLIHLKAIIWLAISRQSTGLISVFKKSHEYEDFSASWPTGDKWWVNQSVIGCGLKLHEVNYSFPILCSRSRNHMAENKGKVKNNRPSFHLRCKNKYK